MPPSKSKKLRFPYIDQFRGLVVVLMLVDHCSYYFNSIWLHLDPLDPLYTSWPQFALRYAGYICAPGFLMMAGAMVWWSFKKNTDKGESLWKVRWQLIQRGLFLILLQMTWVNSSWGGFAAFKPGHFGIIASIGVSIILLTFIIGLKWQFRLIIGLLIWLIHPFLLEIPYDPQDAFSRVIMQGFVDAGSFNKYPVLPWFGHAILGSVMATGWLHKWKTDKQRIGYSLAIAIPVLIIATALRLNRGFGNIFDFSTFGTFAFFGDQKYPPSLFMNLWFFALVLICISVFIAIGKKVPKSLKIFSIPGRVALFFYVMHIAILGVFVKRMDFFYREGGVMTSLIGVIVLWIIMIPLSNWFYGVKRRSNNYLIKMM